MTKKSKFYPKRLVAFKIQIFKQLNQYAFKSSKFGSKLQVLQSRSLESQDLRLGRGARYGDALNLGEGKESVLVSQLFDFNNNLLLKRKCLTGLSSCLPYSPVHGTPLSCN